MRLTLAEFRRLKPDLAAQIGAEAKESFDGDSKRRAQRTRQKRAEREHEEQAALFKWARLNERRLPELRWLFAIPNGGFRHPAVAAKMKAEGVKAGILDIFLPVPRRGYCGCFIEMKVNGNTLTPAQEEWRAALISFGYRVEVCYGWQAAVSVLERHLAEAEE